MRARLAWTWTVWTLALVLVSLASATWAMAHLFAVSIEGGVKATQHALAEAATASVEGELEDARHKLAAMGRLLVTGSGEANDAKSLDRLLDPPDLFLEVGVWSDEETPRVLANVQQAEYSAANSLSQVRPFNTELGQWVERLEKDDPRVVSARAGKTYVTADVVRTRDLASVSMSAPVPDGRVLVGTFDLRRVAELFARFASRPGHRVALLDGGGRLIAQSAAPVADAIRTEGALDHGGWKIRVEDDWHAATAPLRAAHERLILVFLVLSAGCIFVALLLARRVVSPVRDLARAAERLGAGDLGVRSGITRGDEIGDLARSFDRMAQSLQELDRLKSEFVAHVSHELRTPLTSALLSLANVEEGLAGPGSLARVRADLDRLVRMVEGLLDAARLESGIELARTSVTLAEIAQTAVDSLRPLARVPIEVRGSGPKLELDRARVHQVVVNLVDNALRHAKSRVSIEIDGRKLCVEDDGPGVAIDDRARVFERFVRLDANAPGRGAGLGLSIAKKIVDLHGGTIRCEGARFVVEF